MSRPYGKRRGRCPRRLRKRRQTAARLAATSKELPIWACLWRALLLFIRSFR